LIFLQDLLYTVS